jgi:aminoglycoside phosphotransferase (APT) family kinase protein
MGMVPGEKLGEGAGAEAYAWRDGEIVKLFKEGIDPRIVDYEIRVTRACFAAGAPAPEVRDVVEIGGRRGIVLPRYDGATLLEMANAGKISLVEAGATMARLAHSIHAARYETPLRTFREFALGSLSFVRRHTPEDVVDKVQRTVMQLPPNGALCHGDLHAGNILITTDGPRAIDWISAVNADPLMDVARQHLSLTVLLVGDPMAPAGREVDDAFIRTYAELAKTEEPELLAAVAPYMIVMAAMRTMESASTESEHLRLADYIRSTRPS